MEEKLCGEEAGTGMLFGGGGFGSHREHHVHGEHQRVSTTLWQQLLSISFLGLVVVKLLVQVQADPLQSRMLMEE